MANASLRKLTRPKAVFIFVIGFIILQFLFGNVFSGLSRRKTPTFQIITREPLPDYKATFSIAGQASDFKHTRAYTAPTDTRPAARHCDDVSPMQFSELAKSGAQANATVPFVFHFYNGSVISDPDNMHWTSSGFCTVFFVPQSPSAVESDYRNLPVEGMGPDSIHAIVSSPDVRLVLTEQPTYQGWVSTPREPIGGVVLQDDQINYAVYMASYELHHPGYYQIVGEVEWQNYEWVMEDPVDLTDVALPYNMSNVTITSMSPRIYMAGEPKSRTTQQCFHDGYFDMRGRWYNWKAFNPHVGNQTGLNPAAGLENANNNLTFDEFGWTFQPDECHLKTFMPEDMMQCLADRNVQFIGDSHARRLGKSLIAGAKNWCHGTNSTKDRFCQCEDYYQWNGTDGLGNFIDYDYLRDNQKRMDPTLFGYNSSLYYDNVGGVLNAQILNPWQLYYDGSHDPEAEDASIMARRSLQYPADLVYLSLLSWDIAAIRTPAEMLAALPTFRAALYDAYPPNTRFIHRLAHPNCCGETNVKTRYAAPRFDMFNTMWRQFWAPDIRAGRVVIEDPSVLSGRSDAQFQLGDVCRTTHFRSPHVRMELQIWLNAVCDKSGNVTTMRDW